jgi:hypothetical protein
MVMVLAMSAPFAQQRLVIDVSKASNPPPKSNVIHYQGTGSIRNSDERSYKSAQARNSTQAAASRVEAAPAVSRTTISTADERTAKGAQERTTGQATDRHGSVRLDTIR